MTVERAIRVLEQAGFTVRSCVNVHGEVRYGWRRGYSGGGGLSEERLILFAGLHLADTEQLTLEDS